ncbi:MAG TPA: 4Fe-4S dicluster domain-containing protein [bacterium]|nr:4Fe-4S dicluster domain-containing protein [bacterium]
MRRRDFLITAGAASATLAGSTARASSDKPAINFDDQWSVLVDTVVCIGCRKCEWACNQEHKLNDADLKSYEDKSVYNEHRRPHARAYTVLNQFHDARDPRRLWTMKVQCMHCNRPACVSACIVGALQKDPRGPVTYDAWKCIGCRYCMIACPFQIPAYEYHDVLHPEVRKCTFCLHRLEKGERPACVAICPNEALTFGKRRDLIEIAKGRINQHPERYTHHIYGEKEAGGTAWLYLAGADFTNSELPKLGPEPVPETSEKIQHGIFKSFVPPLTLYALLALIMGTQRGASDEPTKEDGHDAS